MRSTVEQLVHDCVTAVRAAGAVSLCSAGVARTSGFVDGKRLPRRCAQAIEPDLERSR
jgi:hypothetical protein